VIEKENFDRSKAYNKDKFKFGFVSGLWSQLLTTAIISFNIIPILWDISGQLTRFIRADGEVMQTLAFVLIGSLASELINLPFEIYSTFVIEERHGFNKYTPSFYVVDKIKKFAVSQTITCLVVSAVVYIIRAGGQFFFFYLWVFVFFVTIALITIYPDFIAPLFDKFTALPEGDLRTKIEELAASIDFPLKKIFVVEGSKRSTHSNAYFFGFYKNKRIVLFDTLIEGYVPSTEGQTQSRKTGCTTDEVVAVLAHELGHWQCNHMLKNLIVMEVNLLCCFAVFGLLFQNVSIFQAFGFTNQRPVFIGLILIFQYIFSPYNEISGFLTTCLSRRFEFQGNVQY
jgi:STE24 endopeptidase